jgi:rhodanese-related sulfurtransferase
MSKKILKFAIFLLLFPISTGAIPPPEIVNNFAPILAQGVAFFLSFILTGWFFLKNFFKKIFKWKFSIFILTITILSLSSIFLNFNTTKQEIIKSQQVLVKLPEPKDYRINKKHGITLEDFENLLTNDKKTKIYDARFIEEYNKGHIIGAEFIEEIVLFKNNGLKKLDKFIEENKNYDKIILYCTNGQRSGYLANILREKGINAFYVNGVPLYLEKFWEGDRFNFVQLKLLTTKEAEKHIENNAIILDPRDSEKYQQKHIASSINFPVAGLDFEELVNFLSVFENETNFIGVCYDNLSCFKASVLAYRIDSLYNEQFIDEKYTFLGIYSTPEELSSYLSDTIKTNSEY